MEEVTPESQLGPQQLLSENVVLIKQEDEDDELVVLDEEPLTFDKHGFVSVSTPKMAPKEEAPRPLEKLYDMGPPPFLTKTYEMVENPQVDEIISWGVSGLTFVVWDIHKFTTLLLPKYFKHANFSSFVRQLNTYGFRKVHFDQWEFANSAFQRDKKHLLKAIKRKHHGTTNDDSRSKFQTDTEIEKLKQEHVALKVEIHELKQEQLNCTKSMATMEEKIRCVEWKQKEFLLFLAKAMKSTPLFQQLLQKYKRKKSLESGQVKRRRLASGDSLDDDPIWNDEIQNLDACHEGDLVEQCSCLTSDTSSSDLSPVNYIMWEKLMEDDVICEDDVKEVFDDNRTKFVHELEDLIAKPPALGSFTDGGEVACP